MITFTEHLTESLQINASMKAFKTLSYEAQRAITSWESSNWHNGDLPKHIRANDGVAQEIERAFAPVRAAIKGDSIKLYRGIWNKAFPSGWEGRVLESWTDDKKVAEHFAGRRTPGDWSSALHDNPRTEQEIDKAVATFHRTGFVTWNGIKYVLNKQHPQYYNMWGRDGFITDGDVENMKQTFMRRRQEKLDHNDSILARGQVLEKMIPKSQIVWLTNNLKSKEYIVRIHA